MRGGSGGGMQKQKPWTFNFHTTLLLVSWRPGWAIFSLSMYTNTAILGKLLGRQPLMVNQLLCTYVYDYVYEFRVALHMFSSNGFPRTAVHHRQVNSRNIERDGDKGVEYNDGGEDL